MLYRSLCPVAFAFPTTPEVYRMMRLANACRAFSPGVSLLRVARLRELARVSAKASAPAVGAAQAPPPQLGCGCSFVGAVPLVRVALPNVPLPPACAPAFPLPGPARYRLLGRG